MNTTISINIAKMTTKSNSGESKSVAQPLYPAWNSVSPTNPPFRLTTGQKSKDDHHVYHQHHHHLVDHHHVDLHQVEFLSLISELPPHAALNRLDLTGNCGGLPEEQVVAIAVTIIRKPLVSKTDRFSENFHWEQSLAILLPGEVCIGRRQENIGGEVFIIQKIHHK